MTASGFFGYLLLSCGPPLALGLPFFYHRSLLALTVVSSMFAWMTIMVITSAIFRGFVPLRPEIGPYALSLVVAVVLEEAARLGLWRLHTGAARKLTELARVAHVQFTALDEIALAFSVGWGHGFTQLLFQFLPFLPMTWYTATAYSVTCPNMSIFLVSCLSQLGIFAVLTGGHVVFVDNMKEHCYWKAATVPLLHMGVSLVSLANFKQDGCYATVPILLTVGLGMALTALYTVWRVASQRQGRIYVRQPP